MNYKVKSFYHNYTYTWTHLVVCQSTNKAILIDPVLDYNPNNANTSTAFIDKVLTHISHNEITLDYILETHAHADHLTSAAYINEQTGAKLAIGEKISDVQATFKTIFNLPEDFKSDGSQFDLLFKDKDSLTFGNCKIQALHTPGHTDDSMSYRIGDCVFIGDTLFSPDYGSARCDFPGGDAEKLYHSAHKIYQLGNNMKLYLCHDYPPESRSPKAWFLSKEQQQNNKHLNLEISKNAFIQLRNKRDKDLNQPRLIIPSIQINIAAGRFPKSENNGTTYLKTPLNILGKN